MGGTKDKIGCCTFEMNGGDACGSEGNRKLLPRDGWMG
jgi:hypothetical protein